MKTLLIILIILLSINIAIAGEISFIKPISPDLMLSDTLIQNGSTPYLQREIIEERRTPETNLMQELEMDLIEIRTLQVCA